MVGVRKEQANGREVRVTCRLCRLSVPVNRTDLVLGLGGGSRSATVCVACLARIGRAWEKLTHGL